MGSEDRAKCLCCGPDLSRWAADHGPTQEHCRLHSLCGHVLAQGRWGDRDHVDGQILGLLHSLAEEEGAGATLPAFPRMGSEDMRLASFYDWPLTAGVPPEPLAAAGFFHTGQQDKVRCFFCYGGLQSWKRGDDPWTEHAKWFPRCPFLLQSKGRDFVYSVQESRSRPLGAWLQSTGTLSRSCPEERPRLKVPQNQELRPWHRSYGSCRRRGCARCVWTGLWLWSLCPAATWPVWSAPPAYSCVPSAGPLSTAVCAPSCPRTATAPSPSQLVQTTQGSTEDSPDPPVPGMQPRTEKEAPAGHGGGFSVPMCGCFRI
ncbi:baculoviral IAP repeat-containing protein 7 isoform X1 [Nycticebus coucang]|uniref:baculoviral IAP repeat-containing protein 7 isoform X1 n=1 Tax=Nycticebus coucang TaxID=9470 RepID=UPI00234DC83E|nr:baculoviral IAP repeat-containing protein 7 isoform X1 [Nycticebus coucang]